MSGPSPEPDPYQLGLRHKELIELNGFYWKEELAKRLAWVVACDPSLSPIDRFDILTRAGYKLDFLTGRYFWPEPTKP